MKKIIVLLAIITALSCSKKEVQLPKADTTLVKEVYDHSPVYIFANITTDTLAEVNRNNTIGSTNWIFNIDKRLKLKHIIPEIQKLQHKKATNPHNKTGSQTYYSYTDSVQKSLAFYPFTQTKYRFDAEFSKFYIVKQAAYYDKFLNFNIHFNKKNEIFVDNTKIDRKEFLSFIHDYVAFSNTNRKIALLHLNFDEELSFQDYITNKILLQSISTQKIQIATLEFVYDVRKLPKCDCVTP